MKLSANFEVDRKHAEFQVNKRFNELAEPHRDAAHKAKRETAASVLAGQLLDQGHPFVQEASLRGVSVEAFAAEIAAKPDAVLVRELRRQRVLLRVAAAKTPAEIKAILSAI